MRHDQVTLTGIPRRPPSLANSPTGCTGRAEASLNGTAATALARVSALDEITHAEQVVKRDLRAVFGGGRAVASGKSQVAVVLEPSALHEFEPDHPVAEPE